MYYFSVPMPYSIEDINKLLNINNQVEKSKITSLFFSYPSNNSLFTGFEQYRNNLHDKDVDYWKKLINHCFKKGTDVIYVLNNPMRLLIEDKDFEQKLNKLNKLLVELQKLGINKLRIAEHKLMSYIEKHYSYFEIYASTSFEFQSLLQYKNFIFMHPNVKQVVPSHDCIKNFALLKNLKRLLPNIEIELMTNEGCIKGCPNRNGHAGEIMDKNIIHKNDINMSNKYYTNIFCNRFNPFNSLVQANNIYPWELNQYSMLGINNFKLVGRDTLVYNPINFLNMCRMYLKGADNITLIEDEPITTFIFHLSLNPILNKLTVKDIKKYLPDINYFKRYGELCSINCGINCNYCYKCAENIEKIAAKKIKQQTEPICVMSKQIYN